ncbi:MAG: hypothetical protein MJ075_07480, partial [Oscillospiraceae bacterium]|nr:hypothetical protein [Oscillospiraceae bacterium]
MDVTYWKNEEGRLVSYDRDTHTLQSFGFAPLAITGAARQVLADDLFGSEGRHMVSSYSAKAEAKTKSMLLKLIGDNKSYDWIIRSIPRSDGNRIYHTLVKVTPEFYRQKEAEAKDDKVDRREMEYWCGLASRKSREHGLECADWYARRFAGDIEKGLLMIRHLLYKPFCMLQTGSPLPPLASPRVEDSGRT